MYITEYEGQNDNVLLKKIKLFRIIQKKKSLIFFKTFRGPRPPLVLVMVRLFIVLQFLHTQTHARSMLKTFFWNNMLKVVGHMCK